ncbi:MAG: L-aspartate oxidase [Candidatus Pseudoscilispira sp.]|nr:L-aspartate oxidase [bacterium 210917-SL.2.15]MDY4036143.1 L-aspartate oxidase [Candidatus Pseudoscilispira sp.]
MKKQDIVIVGSGCAGLFAALQFPADKRITMITKEVIEHSDSFLAQGGICVLKTPEDYQSFFDDTLKAGHYENRKESVDIMIRSSRDTIRELIGYGVDFARAEDGTLLYTREGAHSKPRILYHEDETGKEITSRLLSQVRSARPNVQIIENTAMVDLICQGDTCRGVVIRRADGSYDTISADYTMLACGGIGGLYKHSTNYPQLTGDGLAVCMEHGVALENINYVQIHPTTLYTKKPGRSFLISESVRGEGALLYNAKGERFANELMPRDLLTEAIRAQMANDGTDFVWEDLRPIGEEEIKTHFPNIYARCLEEGYDVTKECIPVTPAQHYFMGGIHVDEESKTTMEHLYAIGETACNGVHGKNRLASNSLLESLVFAKRAALHIIEHYTPQNGPLPAVDFSAYEPAQALAARRKDAILSEIRRLNQHEHQ